MMSFVNDINKLFFNANYDIKKILFVDNIAIWGRKITVKDTLLYCKLFVIK